MRPNGEKTGANGTVLDSSPAAYPPLIYVLAQSANARLELLTGLQEIVGVVDDVGGHEDDELGSIVAVGFVAEESAYIREAVQTRNTG